MYQTAILLRTKAKTTFNDLQVRLSKINKGSSEQRHKNSINSLLKDIENINIIIQSLIDNEVEISNDITNAVQTLQILSRSESVDITEMSTLIASIYFKISNEVNLSSYETKLYNSLLLDLASPFIKEPKLNQIKNLLPLFSEIEYKNLAFGLSKLPNLPCIEITNFLKLYGYVNQYKLDRQLSLLGFVNVAKFHHLSTLNNQYNRLIITTQDVLEGFNIIINYLVQNHLVIDNILQQTISALDIVHYYDPTGMGRLPSGFEIAWGVIDQLIKREKHESIPGRKEKIFITTSFICAQQIIPFLEKNSTLVLDGHGSVISCTFADKPSLLSTDLLLEIKDLLLIDQSKNIDHILLQSCTSGTLKYTQAVTTYLPKKNKIGKNRQIALASTDVSADELFEKVTKDKLDSLAALIFKALVELARNDIAFTFTEDLLCPGALIGQGNIVVKKSAITEHFMPWPKNLRNIDEENILAKSTTIILDANHRKAGISKAFFKHMSFTKQSFKTLERIRSTSSIDGYTTSGDENATPISYPSPDFARSPMYDRFTPGNFGFFSHDSDPVVQPEALKSESFKTLPRSQTPPSIIIDSVNYVTPERIKKISPAVKSEDRSKFFSVLGDIYQFPEALIQEQNRLDNEEHESNLPLQNLLLSSKTRLT